MILPILLYSFLAVTTINCVYYLLFFRFSLLKHASSNKDVNVPVSILVYSKNEQEKLTDFLHQFDKQTHANYELILINNASSDETRYIFEDYQKTHNNVSIVNVINNENFWGSRKYALTLGIKKAKFDNLLFTTTSAIFDSKNWITENVGLLSKNKQIVVGHSYFEKKGGFLNTLIRFSEIVSNLQNYGLAAISKPYQASQYNFGYSKALFFETNGFSDHMSINQGAEDLFLKKNATSKNTVLATSAASLVKKEAPKSFSKWLDYKVAKKQIAKHYNFNVKFNNSVFGLSQFTFFVLALLAAIYIPSTLLFSVIGFRYILIALVLFKTAFKLDDIKSVYFFPFMEIINSLVQLPIFMRNLSSK